MWHSSKDSPVLFYVPSRDVLLKNEYLSNKPAMETVHQLFDLFFLQCTIIGVFVKYSYLGSRLHCDWLWSQIYLEALGHICYNIQGDSGGICNTLGDDSMCDSKKKSPYEHGSDFGRLRSYGHLLIPIHALVLTASYGTSWRVTYSAW